MLGRKCCFSLFCFCGGWGWGEAGNCFFWVFFVVLFFFFFAVGEGDKGMFVEYG